jgi:ATPase family protein associated with various cellular activities (AAA)
VPGGRKAAGLLDDQDSATMSIHKLATDRAGGDAHNGGVSVAFQHDLSDLGEAVIKARAIQAFDHVGTRYPIHRLIRCAASNKLQEVFDDLALNSGLAPQRLDTGSLLLDGDGVFVSAEGYRKSGYCSCTFNVWATSKELADETRAALLRAVGPCRVREQMFVIDWQFCNTRGTLVSTSFDEMADDVVVNEAYPHLGAPVAQFIERYLAAPETVLILLGPPGTGKTRLVRAILAAMSRRKEDSAMAMYTADKRALEGDEIFVDFITGLHDAFVIEDADHLLQPRTDGNRNLHRFLMIADGVVRAQSRKIIFTTNLPNIGNIDDALLRPGRCFAAIQMRPLSRPETDAVLCRLLPANPNAVNRAHEILSAAGRSSSSLAAIYRAASAGG